MSIICGIGKKQTDEWKLGGNGIRSEPFKLSIFIIMRNERAFVSENIIMALCFDLEEVMTADYVCPRVIYLMLTSSKASALVKLTFLSSVEF